MRPVRNSACLLLYFACMALLGVSFHQAFGVDREQLGALTKSIGGRVLKATIWSQGSSQVVRVTYQGDSLPDSISVALALSPGDTTRAVYRKLSGDRIEFHIIEMDPK